ncbi:hypothetical protein A0H76_1771 [Hepatospora eriocheir]|uniref:Uncharacterized protein n=1 Tax=Hepatospora eriocheir TaxID=1081669 RepID=A0A1X0QGL6_9MICR|nr:hypothetical protein A0H76_1771 [Hepatospora eriocheir]
MKVFFYIQTILSTENNLSIVIPQRNIIPNDVFKLATETYLTYHRSSAHLNNPDIKYLDDKHEILVYLLTNLYYSKREFQSSPKVCMISRNILIDRMEPSDILYNFINGKDIIFSINISGVIFIYNSFLNTYFDKIKKLTKEFINSHLYLTGVQTEFSMTSGTRNLKKTFKKPLADDYFYPINYLEVLLLKILKNGDDNVKSQGRPLLVHIKEYKYFCLFNEVHKNTMECLYTNLSQSISKLNELDILNNETHQEILKSNLINNQTNNLIKNIFSSKTTDVFSLMTSIFKIKEQFPSMKEIENLVSQAMDGYFLALLLLQVIDKTLNVVVIDIKDKETRFIVNNFQDIKLKFNLPPDTGIDYFKDKFIEYENKKLGGEFEFLLI